MGDREIVKKGFCECGEGEKGKREKREGQNGRRQSEKREGDTSEFSDGGESSLQGRALWSLCLSLAACWAVRVSLNSM